MIWTPLAKVAKEKAGPHPMGTLQYLQCRRGIFGRYCPSQVGPDGKASRAMDCHGCNGKVHMKQDCPTSSPVAKGKGKVQTQEDGSQKVEKDGRQKAEKAGSKRAKVKVAKVRSRMAKVRVCGRWMTSWASEVSSNSRHRKGGGHKTHGEATMLGGSRAWDR